MFVDIDNTADICVGDILYFKECRQTRSDYWWYAVRVEKIVDFMHVTITYPVISVVRRINYDDWNKSPDFEGEDTRKDGYINIGRLAMLVDESELDKFLDLL